MESSGIKIWNIVVQVCLPVFTIFSYGLVSVKLPQYGVVVGLFSQIFWGTASYRAWKDAGQWGIGLTTIVLTLVFAYGVLNYWFL